MDDSVILRRIENLLGVLLSLVAADGIITQFLLKSGIGYEGNPLLKVFVAESNFLVIKMCGAIICVLILRNVAKRAPKLIFIFSTCLVTLYTILLFWNIAIFLIFSA